VHFIKQTFFSAIAVLLLTVSFALSAQTVGIPNAGLLLTETRELPKIAKQKPEVRVQAPERRKPLQGKAGLQVTVQSFVLTGMTQFTETQLLSLIESYKNRPLGFDELQEAASLITDYYRNAGYLVGLAYLPAQTLKNGVVEMAIWEGYLDSSHIDTDRVELIGKTRISKSVVQRFMDATKAGRLVTDKYASHLSLLVNEIPGIRSVVVLSSGSKLGTSSFGLKVQEGPLLSGYISTDNHGVYSTDYYRYDAGLNINDPFNLGDQLSLRAQATNSGELVTGSINYNLPINGYGTKLAFSLSDLRYRLLGQEFAQLQAEGRAQTLGASIIHPLYLNRDYRIAGTAHYEHRWLSDDINNFDTHNKREIDAMSFSFGGYVYDDKLRSTGLAQGNITLTVGSLAFTDDAASALDSQGLDTKGVYHKVSWQISRYQPIWNSDIAGEISLRINLSGQLASKNIDTSEQMSLGGANAIRAYPSGEASADEGWLVNAEAHYALPRFEHLSGRLALIAFVDTGFTRPNATPLPTDVNNELTGYGVGVNWSGEKGLTMRSSVAWRDSTLPTSDPGLTGNDPQFYCQLTQSF
jgi:hemolysin activation/secretion protein